MGNGGLTEKIRNTDRTKIITKLQKCKKRPIGKRKKRNTFKNFAQVFGNTLLGKLAIANTQQKA